MTVTPTPSRANQTGSTTLWAAIAVLTVVVVALASALFYVQTQKQALRDANVQAQPPAQAAPAAAAPAEAPKATPAAAQKPVAKKPAAAEPKATAKHSGASSAPAAASAPAPQVAPGAPIPAPAAARELCPNCATVVAVTPIEREGATSGGGAVAGGVLGALVGNQFGQGQGKDVATLLGAIGGGIAGNAMEKKTKKITVFQTQVRMDDGSSRLLELPEPYGVGVRVRVEGNSLRPLQ